MRKPRNVLDKRPNGPQTRAMQNLDRYWMAETQGKAERAFEWFVEEREDRDRQAAECVAKDCEELLAS